MANQASGVRAKVSSIVKEAPLNEKRPEAGRLS